ELQGEEAFERYHLLIFKSYFEQNMDISNQEVLNSLAREAKLDYNKFTADLDNGRQREKVRQDYKEAGEKYNVVSIPTVIFGEGRFECAVPIELYRRAVNAALG
ncbi:DsbA family protein, partial [Chloroflexota bacterium]